jgi:hypothetical protein
MFVDARINCWHHEVTSTSRSSCDAALDAALGVFRTRRAVISALLLSDPRVLSASWLKRYSEVGRPVHGSRPSVASGQYRHEGIVTRFVPSCVIEQKPLGVRELLSSPTNASL